MKKICLTKVSELKDALHPNNIAEGWLRIGYIKNEPIVFERFKCYPTDDVMTSETVFSTSAVQEILPDNHFKTLSSIYKWEEIQ